MHSYNELDTSKALGIARTDRADTGKSNEPKTAYTEIMKAGSLSVASEPGVASTNTDDRRR